LTGYWWGQGQKYIYRPVAVSIDEASKSSDGRKQKKRGEYSRGRSSEIGFSKMTDDAACSWSSTIAHFENFSSEVQSQGSH
jgi:hypothetical protein